ncbi:hypothetical protein SEA_BABYDOTZ_63 [Microbacterium phage BabyDotz]|nr:hypothetical protein SEA_BABYDOTZ_63 [Microbacterium phage BabyDotz]
MIDVTARIAEGLGLPESVVQALGAAGWTLLAERGQPVKWVAPPGILIEPMTVVPTVGIVVNSTEDPREVARAVLDQVGRSIAPAHVGLVRGR